MKIQVPSESNPKWGYWIDTEAQTCSCPSWKFRKIGCKHLRKIGIPDRDPSELSLFFKEESKQRYDTSAFLELL